MITPTPRTPATGPGITFGTAGLRAPVGPGADRMNVSTVTRATAGVAQWLRTQGVASPSVAVGFDARYGSNAMARAVAETFAGAGCQVVLLPLPTPTPVIAWLVRERGLDAGVQITASHNPKQDNGYKLYLAGGSQLVSPADREIEECIAATPAAPEIPRSPDVRLDIHAVDGYLNAVTGLVRSGDSTVLAARRNLRVLFTPLHGVGGTVLDEAFRGAGFRSPATVAAQRWPDPEFPTVAFPNPEEPGTCDLLLETAAASGPADRPDLLIALDPDADRCMLGIPDPDDPRGYRMLRGDETGPLLARHLVPAVAEGDDAVAAPVVATTVVSSGLLARIAAASGWDFRETLTGFKHLARAADDAPGDLAFAYEEAIGTCPAPGLVADKDGIATALVAAVWAAGLKAQGRTLRDELAELDDRFGVVRTAQVSVRSAGQAAAAALVADWAASPPAELSDGAPTEVTPLDPAAGTGAGFRVTWSSAPQGSSRDAGADVPLDYRVVVRPSGTEPKAKFYLQVAGPAGDAGPGGADPAVVESALTELREIVRRLTDR